MAAYKAFFSKERIGSLVVALVLLGLAIVFQFYASVYSERVSSNFVHDIFLDNLPVVNLDIIIVEGALGAIAFSIVLLLMKPEYLILPLRHPRFLSQRKLFS